MEILPCPACSHHGPLAHSVFNLFQVPPCRYTGLPLVPAHEACFIPGTLHFLFPPPGTLLSSFTCILNVSSQRRLKQLPPGHPSHSSLTPRLLLHSGFCCLVQIVVHLPRWNIHSLRVRASFVFITKPRTVLRIIRDIEKLSKRFV